MTKPETHSQVAEESGIPLHAMIAMTLDTKLKAIEDEKYEFCEELLYPMLQSLFAEIKEKYNFKYGIRFVSGMGVSFFCQEVAFDRRGYQSDTLGHDKLYQAQQRTDLWERFTATRPEFNAFINIANTLGDDFGYEVGDFNGSEL